MRVQKFLIAPLVDDGMNYYIVIGIGVQVRIIDVFSLVTVSVYTP